MLATEKNTVLQSLIRDASRDELLWINGYLSGLLAAETKPFPVDTASSVLQFKGKLTLAYGTETGNARYLANKLAGIAKQNGIPAKVVALDQYKRNQLPKEEYFMVIISTQGDGEPPAAAEAFCKHIKEAITLNRMRYAVLALGDHSYPLFCQTGVEVDQCLEKNGAQRMAPLLKCDTDFEAPAQQWFETLIQQLAGIRSVQAPKPEFFSPVKERAFYSGTLISSVKLNDRGSAKETFHLEIEAGDTGYQPGDALGVYPANDPAGVASVITLTAENGDREVRYNGEDQSIARLLQYKLNINWLPERVIKKYAALTAQDIPETKMALSDLLKIYPAKDAVAFEELLAILEPLTPRLYSIASSPEQHDGELHLTVARDTFTADGETRYGLCSDHLCSLEEGSVLPFYIHTNSRFRLPDADKDIIMVGPGTGIAPFRAFLHHRAATLAEGKNWLFFGDRNFTTDFLYQTEIQDWIETGLLTRFNAAFSRDQEEKIYVQHRMQEQGAQLFDWLEQGAFFYICGARDPMSKDVEQALLAIISTWGKRTHEEAQAYLQELENAGRYLKDVY